MRKSLWNDCAGGIITTELLLISSVLVAGLLTALSTFRTTVEGEFQQLGNRIHQSTQVNNSAVEVPEAGAKRVEAYRFEAEDLTELTD